MQTVGTLQSFTATGASAPRVAPIPAGDVGLITAGLQAKADRASAGEEDVKAQARQTAVALVNALMPSSKDTQSAAIVAGPSSASSPSMGLDAVNKDANQGPVVKLAGGALVAGALASAGGSTGTLRVISPATGAFLDLSSGATATLGTLIETSGLTLGAPTPLVRTAASTLATSSSLLTLGTGSTLASTTTGALIGVTGGSLTSGKHLVDVAGGSLSVQAPLLSASTGAAVTLAGAVLRGASATLTVPAGESLMKITGASLTADGLVDLSTTTLNLGAGRIAAVSGGGTLTIDAGPAVKLSGAA